MHSDFLWFFVMDTPFIACWESFLISDVFAGYFFLIIQPLSQKVLNWEFEDFVLVA